MAFITVDFQRGWMGSTLKEFFAKVQGQSEEALDRVGLLFVSEIQRGFDIGGLTEKWPDTMQPNLPGIAQRLSDGLGIPERYLGGDKKPLIDSGNLRRSITHRVGKGILFIGTNLNYAPNHHFGLLSTINSKIPDLIKSGNKKVEKELKKMAEQYPKQANFLRTKSTFTIKVKRRPFLVLTEKMIRMAMAEIKAFIQARWKEMNQNG